MLTLAGTNEMAMAGRGDGGGTRQVQMLARGRSAYGVWLNTGVVDCQRARTYQGPHLLDTPECVYPTSELHSGDRISSFVSIMARGGGPAREFSASWRILDPSGAVVAEGEPRTIWPLRRLPSPRWIACPVLELEIPPEWREGEYCVVVNLRETGEGTRADLEREFTLIRAEHRNRAVVESVGPPN